MGEDEIVYVSSVPQLIDVLKNMKEGQMLTLMFEGPEEGEVHGEEK